MYSIDIVAGRVRSGAMRSCTSVDSVRHASPLEPENLTCDNTLSATPKLQTFKYVRMGFLY